MTSTLPPATTPRPRYAGAAHNGADSADAGPITRSQNSRLEAEYDAQLVQRFNAGDESAFIEIMNRYRDRIFSIALALLRNRADAEEIAQDTFVRAYRGLARFRGDSSLATWLHRIALNLARNRYWYFFRRRRHATLSLESELEPGAATTFADLIAANAPEPSRAVVADEFSVLVAACMEKLDARQREILNLRNVLNRSYQEIAAALDINVGTVKSRIARARASLRALIAETCPEFADDAAPADWFEPARHGGRLTVVAA
jgi:RNA polymerase sigma-70 factor (ECF subfamily)